MHRVLFWSEDQPPDAWVDRTPTSPRHAVTAVVDFLKNGRVHADIEGASTCLLCGLEFPPLEMTDGTVAWPALAQHYVIAHKVWAPQHQWLAERILLGDDSPPPEHFMSEDSSDGIPGTAPAVLPVNREPHDPIEPEGPISDEGPGEELDADLDESDLGENDLDHLNEESDVDEEAGDEEDLDEEAEGDPEEEIGADLETEPVDGLDSDLDAVVDPDPWTLVDDQILTEVIQGRPRRPTPPPRSSSLPTSPGRRRRTRRPAPFADGPVGAMTHRSPKGPARTHRERPHPIRDAAEGPPAARPGIHHQICAAYPSVDLDFALKIVAVATAVGAHPADLANILYFESNRTFDPAIRNPRSGAVGLIQFHPQTTPHELGITVEDLAKLGVLDQMDWVQVKLDRARAGQPLNTPHRLAMAVFYPPGIRLSPHHPLPDSIIAENNGISSAHDYLSRVAAAARMPGSAPYPAPYVAPAAPPSSTDSTAGLFDGVLGFFKGLFGADESARAKDMGTLPKVPPALPGPIAQGVRFEASPGLQIRLLDSRNVSHPPGDLPAGSYSMLVWAGNDWRTMGVIELIAGESYLAFEEDGRLKIDRRRA